VFGAVRREKKEKRGIDIEILADHYLLSWKKSSRARFIPQITKYYVVELSAGFF
jgi:hypothetical protein